MGILSGGAPSAPPAPDVWKELSFMQRLDVAAKDVALNGRGMPAAMYAFHFASWFLNYSVFGLLVWATGRPAEMSDVEYGLQTFLKCTVWHHLLEALGFSRQGPLYGNFDGPTNFRYRLTPGTIKESLLPGLGNRRTYADVAVHTVFFVACTAVMLLPKVPIALIRTIFACDAVLVLTDFQQWMASVGHTYMHMLFPACFPISQGSLAGMQVIMVIQWISSGVGKVGPWFSNVNGPFMIQSPWVRGSRWFNRLLFKGEENLAPTCGAACFAHLAAFVEWFCPMLLCASCLGGGASVDLAISFGLLGLLAMHVYIVAAPAPFDVFQWNTYFAITCVYLFWYASWGLDCAGLRAMHPLLFAYLCVETAVVVAGHFLPDRISFYVTHRYWAGNWAQAFFLIRKGAEHKFTAGTLPGFGSPAWDPMPAKLKANMNQMSAAYGAAKGLAYLWLATYNMKIFPAVVKRALCGASEDDYHLVGGMSFANMFQGQTTDMMRALNLTASLGALLDLDEGDCRCIFIQSFPLFSSKSSWKVVDARAGVVAKGQFTTKEVDSVMSLPSACERLASIAHA
mmetsp:Transcript_24298/g.61592  ORF Transcript_24298/g.61592 Transcript_24298/m.61592 type:complete len:568 (-) Transcript_24298:553-2256(-)